MITIIWHHTHGDFHTWETKGLVGQPDAIDKAIYLAGYSPPNFPVPATMMHSAVANFHNREWSWKWAVEWTKARMKF